MSNNPPKNIARFFLEAIIPPSAWLFLKKKQGFNSMLPGIPGNKYLIIAVFIIALAAPANGAAKSIYQPGHETGTNTGQGLPGHAFQHFRKELIAVAYSARLFKGSGFAFASSPALDKNEKNDEDSQTPFGTTFWPFYLVSLVIGFGLGYWVRHWISLHRLKRIREKREVEQSWRPITPLFKSALTPQLAIQKTPYRPEAQTVEKGNAQNATTVVNENALGEKPVVREWIGSEIVNKMPKPKLVDILYFPNPNNAGNFRKSDGRESYIEGTSIYKFMLVSETKAKFEFCLEQSSVNMALNNRNELILSVADEVNVYNSSASKIQIIDNKYGEAILEGTIWKVTNKARIRYV